MSVKRQQKTEHPHIVRVQGVCGGQPIIKNSRLSVQHIAQMYKAGDTVDEILQAHPHVKAAAVYDALSTIWIIKQRSSGKLPTIASRRCKPNMAWR